MKFYERKQQKNEYPKINLDQYIFSRKVHGNRTKEKIRKEMESFLRLKCNLIKIN